MWWYHTILIGSIFGFLNRIRSCSHLILYIVGFFFIFYLIYIPTTYICIKFHHDWFCTAKVFQFCILLRYNIRPIPRTQKLKYSLLESF